MLVRVYRLFTTMMTATNAATLAASVNLRLVARLARVYSRAIRAEESAPTEAQAWRLAKASERALRDLQAAQAGLPLPVRPVPQTARNRGKAGLAALATIGRVIARAVAAQAALRKAQAANAARKVARLARQALRRTGRLVARLALRAVASAVPAVTTTKQEITVMHAPKLAARIHAGQGHNYSEVSVDDWGLLRFVDDAGRFTLTTALRGDRFVFAGGAFGEHDIAADEMITSAERLIAHWQGYVDNTVRAFALRAHHEACRRAGLAVAQRALALVGGAS
jgi:hypothetical protein